MPALSISDVDEPLHFPEQSSNIHDSSVHDGRTCPCRTYAQDCAIPRDPKCGTHPQTIDRGDGRKQQ